MKTPTDSLSEIFLACLAILAVFVLQSCSSTPTTTLNPSRAVSPEDPDDRNIQKNESTVLSPAHCVTPWGETVLHGESIIAYDSPSGLGLAKCVPETRTCNNGVLTGTGLHQTCLVEPR